MGEGAVLSGAIDHASRRCPDRRDPVDIGAAATIHARLLGLAKDGAAVLLISQDLDELFAIADRIAVIAQGRLLRPQPVERITVASLGLNMGGLNQASVVGAAEIRPEPTHA